MKHYLCNGNLVYGAIAQLVSSKAPDMACAGWSEEDNSALISMRFGSGTCAFLAIRGPVGVATSCVYGCRIVTLPGTDMYSVVTEMLQVTGLDKGSTAISFCAGDENNPEQIMPGLWTNVPYSLQKFILDLVFQK